MNTSDRDDFAALEQERNDLRTECEECTALNDKLAGLLRGVAVALKGEEAPLSRHSFHDLPELALAIMSAISAPEAVFINMKAGKIAKPTLNSIIALYGEAQLREALDHA